MTPTQLDFFKRRQQIHSQTAELRRLIKQTLLSTRTPMSLEQITQALYTQDSKAVQHQLHTLAKTPSSEVAHNGHRGVGSRYYLATLLTNRK
jgi:hypothetical protein